MARHREAHDVTESKPHIADEIYADIREYPGHLRQAFSRYASVPEELAQLARNVQSTVDEIHGDDNAASLRMSATSLRAQARHALEEAQKLQGFAGELDTWAWLAETLQWARRRAEEAARDGRT